MYRAAFRYPCPAYEDKIRIIAWPSHWSLIAVLFWNHSKSLLLVILKYLIIANHNYPTFCRMLEVTLPNQLPSLLGP